jgi:hypothetical protein
MFPIADASRRAPEHEDRLWAIFDRECRRTADPAKASDEYFARAEKELNHAIANPRGDGRSISYMRVIRNALDLYGWNPAANNNVVGLTTVVEKTAQSTGAASHTTRPFSSPRGPFDTANIHRPPSIASGLLRRGQITLLAASAGGAKTVFTITLLVALAAGRRQFGAFRIEGQRPGGLKVLYVSAEEEPNSVRLLVGAACQVLALNAAQRALVAQNFDIHDAAESGWLIGPSRPGQDIVPDEHDPAFQQLACLTDRDVVVLDTVAALVAVGNENDNVAVTARMRRLGKAARIGDFALLALHHTPKLTREAAAALRGEAPLVRGGGAFVASARCVLTLTSLPDAEAAQFIVQGFQADRVRRLEHAKLNDGPFMTPAYLALRSELVKVNDGTDVSVRAVEWISAPTGSGSASNALRDLVMRAIDKGATDTQGARVPLSPGGGHKNERDAIEYVGRALMHAEPTLNETQSKRLARDTIRDLQQLGCVVVDEVSVPRYKADGQRDGSRKVKGLVCRWERALWAANKVESQAAATGLSGGENA